MSTTSSATDTCRRTGSSWSPVHVRSGGIFYVTWSLLWLSSWMTHKQHTYHHFLQPLNFLKRKFGKQKISILGTSIFLCGLLSKLTLLPNSQLLSSDQEIWCISLITLLLPLHVSEELRQSCTHIPSLHSHWLCRVGFYTQIRQMLFYSKVKGTVFKFYLSQWAWPTG